MSSPAKRSAASKRTKLPRASDLTKQFLKDWQSLERSGRYDMYRLKTVMVALVSGDELPAERLDHALSGDWKDHRECHVGGDFLLVYQLRNADKDIIFVRAGTHI